MTAVTAHSSRNINVVYKIDVKLFSAMASVLSILISELQYVTANANSFNALARIPTNFTKGVEHTSAEGLNTDECETNTQVG
jgi:hypothetical protein